MKTNIGLFIVTFLVGFLISFLLISKKTTKDINKPQEKTTIQASKFSLEKAPADTLHGDITALSGEVKWQSRVATEGATITEKKQIQQGESLQTEDDGKVSLAFPEMLFALSKKSQLNIIQTLPTSIVLEQTQGTINFQTASTTPLSVRTSPLLIGTTNGNFSVTLDEDKETIIISVADGSITTAYNDSTNYSTVETTRKGQQFIFDISSRTSRIR